MSHVKKCVVWDLDNTIWDGVCLEGAVSLRSGVAAAIRDLDARGILHSIASRGDEETARNTLRGFGLDAYFLVPPDQLASQIAECREDLAGTRLTA